MNVLVRLPNWLGDVVMSFAFVEAVRRTYPEATIDAIVQAPLALLARLCDGLGAVHAFSGQEHRGLLGARRFARRISRQGGYDVFFCLPRSFSSAWMGRFTGSRARVGFATELRGVLLTHAVPRPAGLHRVDEYLRLLAAYSGESPPSVRVVVDAAGAPVLELPSGRNLVLSLDSAAPSRTVPTEVARALVAAIRRRYGVNVILTGTERQAPRLVQLQRDVASLGGVHVFAGGMGLPALAGLVALADFVVSTDSGVAHLANALSRPTVVIFGAGDERQTRPYNADRLRIVRRPGLSCAPCVSNTCRLATLACLADLDVERVIEALDDLVGKKARLET